MAKTEQQRQRKLAKKKSKERLSQKVAAQRRQQMASLTGKMTAAANYPIHGCYISAACLDGRGMGPVMFVREKSPGQFVLAVFLIDSFCLGVKNAMAAYRSRSELTQVLEQMQEHGTFETVTPGVARGYIEAAIAYAASLGFKPHDDYRKIEPIWGTVEPEPIPKHYQFGKDGRPVFISGPGDDEARQNMIFMTLVQTVGEGNFDFTVLHRGSSNFERGSFDFDSIEAADLDDEQFEENSLLEDAGFDEDYETGTDDEINTHDDMTIDGTVTRRIDSPD